jgi:hypothetical protein
MADKNTTSLTDVKNYTFTKGINLDASPEAQPENTYRVALNMLKESSEGDVNFLTTEYSNQFKLRLPGKILSSNLIKQLNKWVLFLDNNEIGVYDANTNTYTTIFKSPCLDFGDYVESVSYTKTECEEIALVFWDGRNRVRTINVTEYLNNPDTDCCINNCDELELYKTADTCIKLTNVNFIDNAAYGVDAGAYRPFIQYQDVDGNTTNYYIINENIPLIEDSLSAAYEAIDGNEPKILNKSIVLNFENLDTNYPYINVGFIKTVGGVSTSFIFRKKQLVAPSITVVYEGDTTFTETVDLGEILNKRAFYLSAKSGIIYNNRLLLAGVRGKKNVDYQRYANNIDVKYVTAKINIIGTKGYKNPEHVIHHKSWMRDENYMLGIVLEFEDMSESPVFPLINKKYPNFPEFTGPEGPRPITNDTALCCTDDRQYWKEVNTAKRIDEKYNAFAKSLSSTDYCSGTIGDDKNTIRSEGYLGYFESEERYPVVPRCGVGPFDPDTYNPNNYMYPTEVIDDKLFGQHITLFKMPDSTIEPFHNNIVDDNAIVQNKNRYDSKFNELEIYPLGLRLENVVMPTLEETGGVQVTGYRLVYVRRDAYNKSIQAKGWFVETFTNDKYDTEYIFPKHNINSGAKWDYFSNQYNPDLTTSNTVTDFVKKCGYGEHYDKALMFYGGNTMATQAGINMNHVKIEQQYNTKGYYIDSVDKQNGFKSPNPNGDEVIDPSTFLDKDGRLRGTAIQIYNMYNYGYVQNPDGSINRDRGYFNRTEDKYRFKNICAENYSYVKDNVILNKILGAEYSLVNFYRESGVFVLLNKKTDLSFNTSYKKYTDQLFTVLNTTTVVIAFNPLISPGEIVTITALGNCINNSIFGPVGRQFTVINNTTLEVIGAPFTQIGVSCTTIDYEVDVERQYFNSDTSSKKCDCGDFLGNEDYYFNNYLDNESDPTQTSLQNCNDGYIYYGSLKNSLPRQYGAIQDMFFIDSGLKACAGQKSVTGFYGDSFINTFSFIRTGVTGMLEDSYIRDINQNFIDKDETTFTISNIISQEKGLLISLYLAQKANVTLINTVTESDYNLDLRYEGPTFDDVYYPKLANGKYKLFSNKLREFAEDCFLNSYLYQLICANAADKCSNDNLALEYNDTYRNFHDNIITMNSDYNELNGMRFYLMKPIDETYKTCDCDTEYDNRIVVSTADNAAITASGFSKFLINNFITVPHAYGKITNLFQESSIIYAHTTDSLWRIQVLESNLQANNNTIYVGTSDILSTQPLNLFISNEGYMGLQDKRHFFQNNYGYFFADMKNQGLMLMSGGKLDIISDYGMRNFFKDYWNEYYNSYTTLVPADLTMGFDYRHKRFLITDKKNEFTLSYYPEDKAFYSLHSYLPIAYLQNRDTFFTQDENYELYLHEDNFNSYRKFYGKHYPSLMDGVFTYHGLLYTTFNNLGVKMDAYENVNNQLVLRDYMPTNVSVWTSRQHSGDIEIVSNVNADYMHNVVMNDTSRILNGVFYHNNFADYVLDSTQNFLDGDIIVQPNANVDFTKNWVYVDRLENNFFNYRIAINDEALENIKYILKFSIFNYNLSLR